MKKDFYRAVFPTVLVLGVTLSATYWYQKSVLVGNVAPAQEEALEVQSFPLANDTSPSTQESPTTAPASSTKPAERWQSRKVYVPDEPSPAPTPIIPTPVVTPASTSDTTASDTNTTPKNNTPPSRRSHAS